MTLESLVAEFAECAAGQYDAIMAGDPDLGNRYSARYIAAFKELRSHGEPGLNALTRLLIHLRADVRVTAAAFLLKHCEVEATAILSREAAKGQGMASFSAKQALLRWREGKSILDTLD
jgi:hypothetical protein